MEKEVRGHIADVAGFRSKLAHIGFFVIEAGRMEDYIFDHPKINLKDSGEKLRIRHYTETGKAQLCWKGKKVFNRKVKSRPEIEVNTTEALSLYRLIEALGFYRRKTIIRDYEFFINVRPKSFDKKTISCRLESFPEITGLYLAEIEGEIDDISETVKSLEMEDVFGPYTLNKLLRKYS